jgi:hypothetical protein
MVASLARVALVILAITSARAELQLTPTVSEYQLEGVKLKQLAFRDGEKKPTYQSPRGWDYSGSGDRLTLHPSGKSQGEATISRAPLPEPYTFTDENLKKLLAEAMASAPKNSSAVSVVSQEKNPLRISGKDTFQVVISYNLLGQTFNRSILFLNRDRDQLRFQFSAREGDFKELQRAFQTSLYSWQNL